MRRVTLALLFITLSGAVASAQDFADAIGSVPQRLQPLKFGMTVGDVQKLIPEAKAIDATKSPTTVFFVFFKPPEVWEAASLDFAAGKLVAIDLMLMQKSADALPRARERAADVIGRNGTGYTRLITLNSAKEPIPAYVWNKSDFLLFVQGPSPGVARSGKPVFAVDPQLRVGIAAKGRPMTEMVAVASTAQMVDILFTLLSPGEPQ